MRFVLRALGSWPFRLPHGTSCPLFPYAAEGMQPKHPGHSLAIDSVGIRMSAFPRRPSTVQARPQPLHASLKAVVIRGSLSLSTINRKILGAAEGCKRQKEWREW